MTYTQSTKVLASIIDEIATGLISSTDTIDNMNHWSNADTAWNTNVRTGMEARRALKYQNGTEIIYIALEARNTWYTNWQSYMAKGLRITFSTSWDPANHTYMGSIQQTSIPFITYSGAQPTVDMAITNITYYLWIESNGFVIMARPEPTAAGSDNSFFAVVERCPNKFYNDNQTNFYCYNVMNNWPTFCSTSYASTPDLHRSFIRPFVYMWPSANVSDRTPNTYCLTFGSFDRSYAFKSSGNGKIYYVKPIIFNNVLEFGQSPIGINAIPIFQSELWFYWSEGMGLIDGDVVAVEGQATKYLVKSLDSSDYTAKITYGIKFVG